LGIRGLVITDTEDIPAAKEGSKDPQGEGGKISKEERDRMIEEMKRQNQNLFAKRK